MPSSYACAGRWGKSVPVDLILYAEDHVEAWGGAPGTLLYEALTEGRVLAGA